MRPTVIRSNIPALIAVQDMRSEWAIVAVYVGTHGADVMPPMTPVRKWIIETAGKEWRSVYEHNLPTLKSRFAPVFVGPDHRSYRAMPIFPTSGGLGIKASVQRCYIDFHCGFDPNILVYGKIDVVEEVIGEPLNEWSPRARMRELVERWKLGEAK